MVQTSWGGHRMAEPMAISMRADLVTSRDDLLDHPRSSFRLPAQDEERPLHTVLVKNVQQAAGVLLDAAFMGGPILEPDGRLERRHLIIIFDVDGQGVQHLGLPTSQRRGVLARRSSVIAD